MIDGAGAQGKRKSKREYEMQFLHHYTSLFRFCDGFRKYLGQSTITTYQVIVDQMKQKGIRCKSSTE